MRNWKLAAITGSLTLATLTPTAFAATQTQSYVETNHGWVSYHSSAALKSPVLGRLQLGDKAQLVKKANAYWYEILWNGKDVYITTNSNYTHVVQDSVPVPTTTTTSTTNTSVASSTTTASQPTTVQYVETNHGWVSYHAAAGLNSPILGRLQLGDKAPLIVKVNNWWYEISWNGQHVYITTNANYTHLVTESSNSSSVSGTSSTASTGTTSISGTSSTGSTGTTSANTGSTTSTTTSTSSTEPAWQQQADKVIATAKTQLGVPYLWGKQEPGIGFDCSNFTAWSYRTALGISFSGASQTQRDSVGTPVALTDIREGDLLFFKTKNNPTGGGHVGIYMGNGMVIQEGGGWGKVTIEPLQGTWLGRNLVYARRVIN